MSIALVLFLLLLLLVFEPQGCVQHGETWPLLFPIG
jgi:hypothetical protein